jgi:hypothetical protein
MGLDIYFYRVKNGSEKNVKELRRIHNRRFRNRFNNFVKRSINKLENADTEDEYINAYEDIFEKIKKYSKSDYIYRKMLLSVASIEKVKEFFLKNKYFFYQEEDAYFRKVNFLYRYFSDRLENEECVVSKEDVEDIIWRCNEVLKNHSLAEELLPTQDGFFFGGISYDDWYFDDVTLCKEKMEKLLEEYGDNDSAYVYMSW